MIPPAKVTECATQTPERTAAERDARLIDQAFGNIHIEHPEVTRELVAERLRLRRIAEVENVTND
jgi:hypothetical protein